MKYFTIPLIFILLGCQALPQLYQAAENIADDDAVKVVLSKEAIQKETDMTVYVTTKGSQ